MQRGQFVAAAAFAFAIGCDSNAGTGELAVLLFPESNITIGFGPSEDDVTMVDGWTVAYDTYLLALGDVHVGRSDDGSTFDVATAHVADLLAVRSSGEVLAEVPHVASGRWDRFGYDFVAPTASTPRDETVAAADFDRMVAEGCTLLLRGRITNPAGLSHPPGGSERTAEEVAFELCLPATAEYSDCTPEFGLPGVVVNPGATALVELTLHGDHFFFTRFPTGHGLVERRAQWLANADLDADGLVTGDELRAIDTPLELSALYPSSLGYDFANAPGGPIGSAFDVANDLLRTLGHFQGEGECVWGVPTP